MESNINSALKKGYLQQIRFLIEYGHSINERDENLRTPLINCAFIDDDAWAIGIARLFLEKGAKISFYDKLGLNALHYAALQEKRPLVQLYLSAIDFNINAGDKFGNTALHYAACTGDINIVNDLATTYRKYGLSVNKKNRKGETALVQAWKAGHFQCGEILVDVAGADSDITDVSEGMTAREVYQRSVKKIEFEAPEEKAQSATSRRPKTALRRIQLNSPRPSTVSRPPSGLINIRKPSFPLSARGKENDNCNPVPPVLRKTKSSVFYHPASINDLRNNPKYVFQLSPVEYFSTYGSDIKYSYPFALERTSSAASSRYHENSTDKIEAAINSNWRNALKTYMISYDYQFAHSYRKSAIPPEPEPEENLEDRPDSPTGSDMDEQASQSSKKGSKKQEKHEKHDKQEKHEKHDKKKDKHDKGKKSNLGVPSNLTNADSSSSESINTKGTSSNQKRNSRMGDESIMDSTTKKDRLKSAKPGAGRDGNLSRTSFTKK